MGKKKHKNPFKMWQPYVFAIINYFIGSIIGGLVFILFILALGGGT